jgi:hypothetical protein
VPTRLAGLALFLPVPFVLYLFTRLPGSPSAALLLGVMLVATHRLYARPFALASAERRCLWCGGAAGGGPDLTVDEPGARTRWRACGDAHEGRLRGFLWWTAGRRRILQAGILGSLLAYLGLAAAVAVGLDPPWSLGDAVALFQGGIAVTVLPVGWLAPRGAAPSSPDDPPRTPFPVHIQALVGTLAVVWLFRLVGLLWLAAALAHLGQRLGPAAG